MSMANIETLFNYYVFLACLSLALYLPRMYYWISGFQKQRRLANKTKNRLAVLVPARNESAGIALLLDSLARQSYGRENFDTFVIVKSEDDPTCEIAKKYAHTRVQVIKNQTCKGEALDGSLKEILRGGKANYAAYIIVDGDNIVDKNFVAEMNNALLTGRQIVLGKRNIKNYLLGDKKMRSLATNCSALVYTFIDKLGNAFRGKEDIPCTMCGTGLMVRRDVIEALDGWPYRSCTEDLELTVNCILHGWSSCFYEHAVTYTEEPLTHKLANDRRKRWVLGYMQILFKYRPEIVRQTYASLFDRSLSLSEKIKGIRTLNFDYLYSFAPFILYLIVTVIAALLFLSSFAHNFFAHGVLSFAELQYALVVLGAAYLALAFYTALGFAADRKSLSIPFLEKVAVVFYNPFYMSEWAGFYVSAFVKLLRDPNANPADAWKPIARIESVEERE